MKLYTVTVIIFLVIANSLYSQEKEVLILKGFEEFDGQTFPLFQDNSGNTEMYHFCGDEYNNVKDSNNKTIGVLIDYDLMIGNKDFVGREFEISFKYNEKAVCHEVFSMTIR